MSLADSASTRVDTHPSLWAPVSGCESGSASPVHFVPMISLLSASSVFAPEARLAAGNVPSRMRLDDNQRIGWIPHGPRAALCSSRRSLPRAKAEQDESKEKSRKGA